MNCPITPGRYAQAGFVDGSMRVHDVRRPDSPLAQSVSFSGCQKLYNLRSDGCMCRNAEQRVSRCRVSRLTWIQDIIVASAGSEMVFSREQGGSIIREKFGEHHTDYLRDFTVSNRSVEQPYALQSIMR